MTSPTTDERITTLRAALTKQRAERKDELDLPRTMTPREVNTYLAETATLDKKIAAFNTTLEMWTTLPTHDADGKWLDQLNAWRHVLCTELLALPSRIRDAQLLGVQQNLTLSIRAIDFGLTVLKDTGYGLTNLRLGQLMVASGYEVVGADLNRNYTGELPWFGSIKEVEHRITDVEQRRQRAQAALDDALMDDDARAKRDAEAQARREALNAPPQRKVRGDGSQYDKYPDGRRVEVTT
jgi:hypothetical protein